MYPDYLNVSRCILKSKCIQMYPVVQIHPEVQIYPDVFCCICLSLVVSLGPNDQVFTSNFQEFKKMIYSSVI